MAERIDTLVILGAGGDLTSRLLLPGVASFLASSQGQSVAILGADRVELTPAQWQEKVASSFHEYPSSLGRKVAKASRYIVADATDPADLRRVLDAATGRIALYFALPPAIAARACEALST